VAADLKQFPLEKNSSEDAQHGALYPEQGLAVNFEPLRVTAGDRLVPKDPELAYQIAVYSPTPDPQYIYTYAYPSDSNLTVFERAKSVFDAKTGAYRFTESAYVRLIIHKALSETGAFLSDFFYWEGNAEEEPVPDWIEEEAERVARRVKRRRRPEDAVFLLLSDSHYTIGCNWRFTRASLTAVQRRVSAEGLIHLGDITDGLLPGEWTVRYTKRVVSDMQLLGIPCYGCLGNHDRNYFRGNSYGLSRSECSQLCLGRPEPDYCIDYPEQRLRMIFLDSFDPQRKERYGFSNDTVRHLAKMLEQAPDGFRVMVFSHVPPLAKLHVWSNTILNSGQAIRLLHDFRKKRGGDVLGWVHGHNHADQIDFSQGFPIVSVGCSKLESFWEYKPAGSVTQMRRAGEPSQELWDVLVVHAHSRDFDLIRYGAGVDRYIRL